MFTIDYSAKAEVSVTGILEIGEVLVVGAPVKRVRKVATTAIKADREVRKNLWSTTEAAELLGLSYGGFKHAADRAARRFNIIGRKVGARLYYSEADLDWIRRLALGQGQHEY